MLRLPLPCVVIATVTTCMCICSREQCRLYIFFTLVLYYCSMSNLSEKHNGKNENKPCLRTPRTTLAWTGQRRSTVINGSKSTYAKVHDPHRHSNTTDHGQIIQKLKEQDFLFLPMTHILISWAHLWNFTNFTNKCTMWYVTPWWAP